MRLAPPRSSRLVHPRRDRPGRSSDLPTAHRDAGHGHPAYDPKTLLTVLLYGHCLGVRSSRQLERRCQEDIAFRVLAANQTPDHVTIARFRARHEQALAGFLVQSLRLCAAAGMVKVGVV